MDYDKHNALLRSLGLDDMADRNISNMQKEERQRILWTQFEYAEHLSKMGNFKDSNMLCLGIKDSADFSAPLYKRMAINYRKLKEYNNEIKIINEFLKERQKEYGGRMWIDEFSVRLKKAKELKSKGKKK